MNKHDSSNKVFKLNSDKVVLDDGDFVIRSRASLPMVISNDRPDYIDTSVVASKYYNGFNFLKLPEEFRKLQMAFGITSSQKGEGKTLVSANMAVSMAKAYELKTVIVDLNFKKPKLHKIFGVDLSPGIVETFQGQKMKLTQTKIDNLYVLPAGSSKNYHPGVNDLSILRKLINTLKESFDFVIVDMNSIFPVREYPVLFANEMDGLLAVVDTQRTKQEELDKIYRHVNEDQVIGYIFNKVDKRNTY